MPIIDQFGREFDSKRPKTEEFDPGGATNLRNTSFLYPANGLTPQKLTAIFKEADRGEMRQIMELYMQMEEKDTQLTSILATRKLAVTGLEWEIQPASDDARDVAASDFAKEEFIPAIENFNDSIFDLLDAIGKGYSVVELVWNFHDNNFFVQMMKWWDQRVFTFLESDSTISEFPKMITDDNNVYGETLEPGRFMVHDARTRSGNMNRGGVLRSMSWVYLFKNYTLKDWVALNERLAFPLRLGKFTNSATEADREALRDAVFNLGTDAAAILSESAMIEIVESQTKGTSAQMYKDLADYVDRAMTKAVLGHTGASDSTAGRLGGDDMASEVRKDLIDADTRALSSTIRRDLLAPMTVYNFGADVGVPIFSFIPQDNTDLKVLSETLKTMQTLGMPIPKEWSQRKFGVPQPKDEKDTLVPSPTSTGIF